jgi:hypothetical protein
MKFQKKPPNTKHTHTLKKGKKPETSSSCKTSSTAEQQEEDENSKLSGGKWQKEREGEKGFEK